MMPSEAFKLVDDATTPHVWRKIGPFLMEVRPETTDIDLARHVIERCEYSGRVTLGPGQVWLDIGASLGAFALQAAAANSAVYAFEPEPINFAMLTHNIEANKLPFTGSQGIHPVQAAISDSNESEVPFYLNRYRGKGSHSLYVQGGRVPSRVNNLHIAAVMDSIPAVNNLKIDAEGAEWGILMGLQPRHWERLQQVVFEYHFNILKDRDKNRYLYVIHLLSQHFSQVQYRKPDEVGGNWHAIVSARK